MTTQPENNLKQISKKLGLSQLTALELLQSFAAVINELLYRGIVRTKNNPVADYTEWLVSSKLDLKLQGNSSSGFDAIDQRGITYQIKGRRTTRENRSTQLSAIRNIDSRPFDFLIAVIFFLDFSLAYAAKIPIEVVAEIASYREHVNAHILSVRPSIFADDRVEDITERLAA